MLHLSISAPCRHADNHDVIASAVIGIAVAVVDPTLMQEKTVTSNCSIAIRCA